MGTRTCEGLCSGGEGARVLSPEKSSFGGSFSPSEGCPRWREEQSPKMVHVALLGTEFPVLGGVQAEVPLA